jgi:hypothetical protein
MTRPMPSELHALSESVRVRSSQNGYTYRDAWRARSEPCMEG